MDSAPPAAHNPRGIAILIDDLFHFLGFHAMSCDVLHIIVVPLGLQFLEPHDRRISRQTAVLLQLRHAHFLSRNLIFPLAVFDCTVGWYINSARAGATLKSPGT